MKTIAICAKPDTPMVALIGGTLVDWLKQRDQIILMDEMASVQIRKPADRIIENTIPPQTDLVIVLGGDGTILRVARLLEDHQTPIMAVNLGGLGFLTSFTPEEMLQELDKILQNRFQVLNRLMLQTRLFRDNTLIYENTILNDVVFKESTLSRIIKLSTWVDDVPITTYHGDGLIISTPTGSTGYSLSAGGPIICSHLKAIILTPICPHSFAHRPIVIGPEQVVEVRLESSHGEVSLTIDGQVRYAMQYRDKVLVTGAPVQTRLIQNPNTTYFQVLSHKLKWGLI
ncbi:NAD(+)/NADH kinase [bacterium]|nr:NAD(+)/NADH kinase [candidate division CSSED10-310 bacterium]